MTLLDLRKHADTITTILWNHGADVRGPFFDRYGGTSIVLSVTAKLPGPQAPSPAEVVFQEVWEPVAEEHYQRVEYLYDLIDRPRSRRRAFHAHDVPQFISEFDVVTHEHCEHALGAPTCTHYYGLPVDAYDAFRSFALIWGQRGPLGCEELRCMT